MRAIAGRRRGCRCARTFGHIQWLGSRDHLYGYYLRGRDVVNIVTQEDTDQWVEEGWSVPGDPDEMRLSFPKPRPRLQSLLGAVTQCSKWGLSGD